MRWSLGCFALLSGLWSGLSLAHDQWANGGPVPDWVKASCCGPADAHHLRPDQVHRISEDMYQVDGFGKVLSRMALPSQDGDYWIFYRDASPTAVQSNVYCFFVPMNF